MTHQPDLMEVLHLERIAAEWNPAAFKDFLPNFHSPRDLSSLDWVKILTDYPELEGFCTCFDQFTALDWQKLLQIQPQFASRCSCWHDFTAAAWRNLLRHQPQFLEYCPMPQAPEVICGLLAGGAIQIEDVDITLFSVADWFWAVKYAPTLWTQCPCAKQFNREMWWSLLFHAPELAAYCPFLTVFNIDDWKSLLQKQPQLLCDCISVMAEKKESQGKTSQNSGAHSTLLPA